MNYTRRLSRFSLAVAALSLVTLLPVASFSQASTSAPSTGVSTSQQGDSGPTYTATVPATGLTKEKLTRVPSGNLWKHPGIGIGVGINGINFDIAEPLGQHFNVRAGGEYLRYTGDFTSDGAQINAALSVGGGHVALDYYPWHNGFRISPQVRFAIQTEANIKVIVPSGQEISLDGGDYRSSATDPLRGTGHVDTRKAAPGISIGYGNLSPRHGAHWSFPVEVGFYYIGQPNLQVTFTGSACDPTQPPAIGCQTVTTDPGFQADLKKFIARQNNNLSYASFFPIASIGTGYRF